MKQKKEKKKLGLMIFIIIIMVGTSFSFVFYGFSPATERVRYNGISFLSNGNEWRAEINNVESAFGFNPKQVESVKVAEGFNEILNGKYQIDMTYDINSTFKETIALAQYQIEQTLNAHGLFARKGFTMSNTFNLPVITCENATQSVPVVYFREGDSTQIDVEGSCVIATASSTTDIMREKDRIVYAVLGVMK